MPSLAPETTGFHRQFSAVKTEASEIVKGLRETQFNWRPHPQSWSMAECLLHLNIVGDRYVHLIEKAVTDARARGLEGQSPAGYGWLGKWILANTEPPPKRKSRSARATTPAYGQPLTAVMPTFLHLQDQLAMQVESAAGLDWARVKVPAPMGPFRFNLHLTFAWIAAHERRHLWQARQVLNHAEFPRVK